MHIWKDFPVSTPRGIFDGIYSVITAQLVDYTVNFPYYILRGILQGNISSFPQPITA
jgi:hypothetical protein